MTVTEASPYQAKLSFDSSHTRALAAVPDGKIVLDVGCAAGFLAGTLKNKGCHVTGIDRGAGAPGSNFDEYHQADLNAGPLPVDAGRYDVILLLDVIEHLVNPEAFIERLARSLRGRNEVELIATTGNVAFIAIRAMLLFGVFNYAERGILDRTHTRLFTFSSFRKLFTDAGFEIIETHGIPAPFPLAFGDNAAARGLLALNRLLICISKGLFSFQIFLRVRMR